MRRARRLRPSSKYSRLVLLDGAVAVGVVVVVVVVDVATHLLLYFMMLFCCCFC